MIFILISSVSIASTPSKSLNDYYIHGKEPTVLYQKIKRFEDKDPIKNKLSYKDDNDLMETCKIICSNSDENWSKYDLVTFAIGESKLNRKAFNRLDGGKGLYQLTGSWYKKLDWVTNPYNKKQNTKAAKWLLNENLKRFKSKHEAIKRFNGSNVKANNYRKRFYKLRYEIIKS